MILQGRDIFTREYIVATNQFNNTKFSVGMGWGKFTGKNSFKNPLSQLSSSLKTRPRVSNYYKRGGSPSYDQWFRGDVSIFGGLEHSLSFARGLNFKLEYDPIDYLDFSANNRVGTIYALRKKDSDINFGLSYALNKHMTLDASYIKGNTFNLSFNLAITFDNSLSTKPKFKPKVIKQDDIKGEKNIFYEDLLHNLNSNRLFLQTSTLHKNGNLDVSISTSDHRNAIRSSSYAASISKKVADLNEIDLSLINVSHINAGIELNNITYIADHVNENLNTPIELKIRNSRIDSGDPNHFLDDEFRPRVIFPSIFSSISPTIVFSYW
ncbi:MAG: YjbH domain-containing protein [Gammaproteobacteria bacterium]